MNEMELLKSFLACGKITADDISDVERMNKEQKLKELGVLEKIWQGTGKDTRWMAHIRTDEGRKKVAKKNKSDLINYLYDYYCEKPKSYKDCTLTDVYEEWIQHKLKVAKRPTTVERLESDYKRYYLNEELSKELISTPLSSITIRVAKDWALQMIKKYDMDYKAWMNCRTIINQVYQYLMEDEKIARNPFSCFKLEKGTCRVKEKPPASTQIFYMEEKIAIFALAAQRAKEKKDASFYAILLCFLLGCRIGECLALDYADFNKSDMTVHIGKMVAASTERKAAGKWTTREYSVKPFLKKDTPPRDVVITKPVLNVVNEIRKIQMANGELSFHLFPGVHPGKVQKQLYSICDTLDIFRRSPHKARKTYVSELLNAGMDGEFVMKQVGHHDIRTTLGGYDFSTTQRKKLQEELEKILAV